MRAGVFASGGKPGERPILGRRGGRVRRHDRAGAPPRSALAHGTGIMFRAAHLAHATTTRDTAGKHGEPTGSRNHSRAGETAALSGVTQYGDR